MKHNNPKTITDSTPNIHNATIQDKLMQILNVKDQSTSQKIETVNTFL